MEVEADGDVRIGVALVDVSGAREPNSNERRAVLQARRRPAAFGDYRFELVQRGDDIGPTGLAEEVEIVGWSLGESGCEDRAAAGQQESRRCGSKKNIRATSAWNPVRPLMTRRRPGLVAMPCERRGE